MDPVTFGDTLNGRSQWFSVGQNYPTWLPSKFSTTLEPPLIFGKFLQSSAGTTYMNTSVLEDNARNDAA